VFALAFICSLGSFYFGYSMVAINSTAKTLTSYYEWTDDESTSIISLLTGLVPAGAIVGALLGSVLAKCGRRFSCIVIDILGITGYLFMNLAIYGNNY